MIVVTVLLSAFAGYLSAYVLYQLLLFCANALVRDPSDFEPLTFRRFNVVIPAHNEELYLARLLASLGSQGYPKDRYRVTVVADNCEDGTVAACRAFDVAVLERVDAVQRGKGHAIRYALEQMDLNDFNAVVIVDGDSVVNAGLLHHLNLQMERGDRVIQCYNGVANPQQSWFTRLMDVSRTISNDIVHPGKRKLGLSSHLMGNGMCFDVEIFKAQGGWHAFSVGEDWEYYARLVLSGTAIGYSRLSRVYHQESVNLRQASSQRMRWSSGRLQVLRDYGPSLFIQGIRTGNLRCVDASLPLLLPNPSLGMNLTFLGWCVAGGYSALSGNTTLLIWYSALGLLQVMMFLIGVLHTKHKTANAMSLVLAPMFLVWKMGIDVLSLFGLGRKDWKRTERRLS